MLHREYLNLAKRFQSLGMMRKAAFYLGKSEAHAMYEIEDECKLRDFLVKIEHLELEWFE